MVYMPLKLALNHLVSFTSTYYAYITNLKSDIQNQTKSYAPNLLSFTSIFDALLLFVLLEH